MEDNNSSLREGEAVKEWKRANILLIYKGENKVHNEEETAPNKAILVTIHCASKNLNPLETKTLILRLSHFSLD